MPIRFVFRKVALPLIALLSLFGASLAVAAALTAPEKAVIGSEIEVGVTGSSNDRDFVTIVKKGTAAGTYDYYQYAKKQTTIKAPTEPGDYELRLLGASSPYPTLASRAIKIEAISATLEAPASVGAGVKFQVKWTGPANARDYIGIGDASRPYHVYAYTESGNPVTLTAPDQGGDYELRYFLGNGDKVIGTRKLTVGTTAATLTVPAQVNAGAKFSVSWKGPGNPNDFIVIAKAGAPERTYDRYVYAREGATVQLVAPDAPGDYEVRYLTGQTYATLGSSKFTVGGVSASLQGPAEAVAGSTLSVGWKGPNNPRDYITIVPKGAREGEFKTYGYTADGNPAKFAAPLQAGDYELRYLTGQSYSTLARAAIRITPAKQEPGTVKVTATTTLGANGGVEIILDASGSMLQKIGGQRRIDIAKQTLTKLTASVIPANTPFAFRVFGREVDSCQTDLEIPLSPLNPAAVASKINALEAKNNAKTPIGASLEKVASDLASVKGERLVVIVTDGEETCGGDPADAIKKLKQAGVTLRVNIVGFAIDDPKLAATFRNWSELGSGAYFDAKDAAGLNNALAQSMRASFEIVTAQGQVVASGVTGGDAVSVLPGTYNVRIKGQEKRTQSVTVQTKTQAEVKF